MNNIMQDQVNNAVESAKEAAASVTERVTSFFHGNPFATPIGAKIEMATNPSVFGTENWELNMEICDYINGTADGARDALRAIRRRLHSHVSKNNGIVMYTLTVLETCVKNCDVRFHELVCHKDFINDLVKLIGPKFDAPQVVQERVLNLIQSWNDAFRDDPRLQGVCQVYDELKAKGVQFPIQDPVNMAPVLTPKRVSWIEFRFDWYNPSSYPLCDYPELINPTEDQFEKLRKELNVVNDNVKVMREILNEMVPGKEDADSFQLLVELYPVVKQMHFRTQDLIGCVQNDEVMYELLIINDDCNSLFEKYDRYMSNRASGTKENATAKIDMVGFDKQMLSQQLSQMKVSEDLGEVDASELSAGDKNTPVTDKEAAEMAEWLEAQEGKKSENTHSCMQPSSMFQNIS
ncbi:unnamed protein product [Thelazia callipaeda]|uniref:VHS domain-containing protein n=1 Tax=Thelazia callipaeda TaxID=103827 RepID=A0A0N5CV39_THECL|nr:unnamed protein product [Thelazia callipaeda]